MKKILLATSALVMTAGLASAEGVEVSGAAAMWVANDGSNTTFNHSIDVTFSMSGASDSGFEFGASVTLQENGDTDGPGSVWIASGGHKFAMGDVDSADAAVGVGMPDIGFDGLGVDNVAERNRNASGSEALYTYNGGALSFAVSVDDPSVSDDYAIGVGYAGDAFSAALGYADDSGEKIVNAKLGATFSGVAATVYIEDSDVDGQGYGVHLAYTTGALTLGAAYADNDAATDAAMGIDAAYDLGGGATLKGGVADTGGAAGTVWDVGMSFTF